jgi:hypothetical protein
MLNKYRPPVIIDEIQNVPQLMSYIKARIDSLEIDILIERVDRYYPIEIKLSSAIDQARSLSEY